MKLIVKKGFKLLGTHGMGLGVSVFLLFVMGWTITKWGMLPFSVAASLCYAGLFYSDGWNWGRAEGRPYSQIRKNPLRALGASAVPGIVCAALAVLTGLNVFSPWMSVISKVWYFPFAAFFREEETIRVHEILLCGAVIPVVTVLGYFVGTKNFSVMERIAFRKNRKKEQERLKAKKGQ